ncbi:hydroxyacid dehydrogenase [Pseudomonas proteolytica]|uniref:Hydroxyacid dehydrogenase n=1 Tax=Pseudomonas proteolytica TaxID=219574 RepID=A0AAW5A6E9_9PSED|nr:DNA circularization N-terminal domain-containing protein [Pseudomonas proteolytica]MCF5056792.1 hydroxyacid dehydrogenase [Pseudomonas proteolytica]MCF5102612.1 hydroxyacid dehydrogenase [Pseudomonas proteolytica]
MTKTWRDDLLPASFRGIKFLIEQATVPVGRKGQLHEYPQRDEPFFESLGKQSQVHKVSAFVIGDDCFERRDKLLEALEKEGPGELVHPWLGRMQVDVGECDLSHSRPEGGMARLELTFYPSKPRKFPTGTANTQQQVVKSSETLLQSALRRYKAAMALVDKARINMIGLRNGLSNVYAIIQRQFTPFLGLFTNLSGFIQSLVNSPSALSALFSSYFSDFSTSGLFRTGVSRSSSSSGQGTSGAGTVTAPSYRSSVAVASQHAEAVASINTVPPAGGTDTTAAAQAVADLVQDALLVQVALIISEMPVATQPVTVESTPSIDHQAVQPVERPEVPVADDVIELRDALSEAIWNASLKADPEHYQALNTLRQALVKHLTAVAASGVRLVDITPAETLPALVLAYRRFGDATRAGEVVQRNRIQHPGFVPAVPLKIAQE